MRAKDKYSAKELAPIIGLSVSQISRKGWTATNEPCKGGYAKMYIFSMLPKAIKEQLVLAELKPFNLAPIPTITKSLVKAADHHLPAITDLKDWQRNVMDARLAILKAIDELEKVYGLNNAIATLINRVKENKLPGNMDYLNSVIPTANARGGKSGKRTLSRTSIYRWRRELKKGVTALAPVTVEKSEIPAWAPYFIERYNRPQKPTIPEAMEEMLDILPQGIIMPSYSQVRRFHNKRSRLDRQKGRKAGSELDAHKGYRKRDTSELLPMDVGCCDGHSFKARIAHPRHGRPFYPEICSCVDAATRVITGWSVGLAESAQTVADSVRHTATITETKKEGGVYSILYSDGGSGNKAKVNTDAFIGLFPRLGTRWEKGRPANAKGHGLIEIINKTVWIRSAKKLATFSGKSMDKLAYRKMYLLVNKEIKKKGYSEYLPSWPAFLTHCQETVDAYNRRSHSELPKIIDPETGKKRHMCPLEMWSWHISQGWKPKENQLSEGDIEALFMPREEAKVRRSQVTIFKNSYYSKDLEHYNGERLQVGYDIHDAEKVVVWDKDGRKVCTAHFEKNKSSYFPMPVVEQAREQRAKRRTQIKLDQLDEIEAELHGTVNLEPPTAEIIDITAASPKITADREKLAAEMAEKTVEIPQDDRGKYKFWNELDARMAAGSTLTEREVRFYEAYRNTRSYRAFKDVENDLALDQAISK